MMHILRNIRTLHQCLDEGLQDDTHPVDKAAMVFDEHVIWVGKESELPEQYSTLPEIDAGDSLVIPGLIDAHTHLVFGGWRDDEFELRLKGFTYLDVAKRGGGILSTVEATRRTSSEILFSKAEHVLDHYLKLGVTCVEAKSGYGLLTEDEIRILDIYRKLNEFHPVEIVSTFLGAHSIPKEYAAHRDKYVDLICEEMLPRVAENELARFCDAFIEETAFTAAEVEAIFRAAKELGFGLKLHADQITNQRGAQLAAEFGAHSADHLESISKQGMDALEHSTTIAVSLPIATVYLHQHPIPAHAMMNKHIPIAVATDFNPGSAPSFDLHYAMHLACVFQRMTPTEVLKGATIYAARSMGEQDRRGSLEPGKVADFALIEAPSMRHWMYHFHAEYCTSTYIQGSKVFDRWEPISV